MNSVGLLALGIVFSNQNWLLSLHPTQRGAKGAVNYGVFVKKHIVSYRLKF